MAGARRSEASLPVEIAREIDRLCSEFESARRAGEPAEIEHYLDSADESFRQILLCELVLLEIELSGTGRDDKEVDNYLNRFPDDKAALRRVLVPGAVEKTFDPMGDTHTFASPGVDSVPDPAGLSRQVDARGGGAPMAVLADYELLEVLGRGGMGVVYRARQLNAERDVALKVIRPDRLESHGGQEAVQRFQTEAKATARLSHENIVTVYDVGETGGEYFFSMQLVSGESLTDTLKQRPIDQREAATIIEAISRAVHEAHAHGILHRDIKPGNILIEESTGKPLIADFGLAKLTEGGQTVTVAGQIFGSPPYMSPEQATDATKVTISSDVYSLGATLFHILTGEPPFSGDSIPEILRRVVEEHPVAPRQLNPAVVRDLETICLKCLEKEPQERYSNADALADDLRSFLEGKPVLARPVGNAGKLWRWCRRNPITASLVSALFAAISIGLVVSNSYRLYAESQTVEAKDSYRQARNSIDDMTRIATSLRDVPGVDRERREMLETALKYYTEFAANRGSDDLLKYDLAGAWFHVSEISAEFGDTNRAVTAMERSIQLFRELVAEDPKEISGREELARALNNLGNLKARLASTEDAFRLLRESIDVWKSLVADTPRDARFRFNLAGGYLNLGVAYRKVGRLEKAIAEYANSIEELNRTLELDPAHSNAKLSLAGAARNIGNALDDMGRTTEAETRLKSAVETLSTRISPESRDSQARQALADTINSHAVVLRKLTRLDDALDAYQRATDIYRGLLRDHPENVTFQNLVARSFHNMSYAQESAGRTDEALVGLKEAVRIRKRLAQDFPRDPEWKSDLANSCRRLAESLAKRGESVQAEAAHREALQNLATIVKQYPDVADYRIRLGQTQRALGIFLSQAGESDESFRMFNDSLNTYQQLLSLLPDSVEVSLGIAAGHGNVGVGLLQRGERDDGIKELQKSVEILLPALERYPKRLRIRLDLAQNYETMGDIMLQSQSGEEAANHYESALHHRVRLAGLNAENPVYQSRVGRTINRIAQVRLQLQQPEDALKLLDEGLNPLRDLVNQHSTTLEFRSELGDFLDTRAMVLTALKRPDDAIATLQEAISHHRITVEKAPRVTRFRQLLNLTLFRLGTMFREVRNAEEAASLALERKALWPGNPTEIYNAACELALCIPLVGENPEELTQTETATCKRFKDGAIATLKEAIEAGFSDIDHVRHDSDLDSIREDPRFKDLISEDDDAESLSRDRSR